SRIICSEAISKKIGYKNPTSCKLILQNKHRFWAYFRVCLKSIRIIKQVQISSCIKRNSRNKLSPLEFLVGFPAIYVYGFFIIFIRVKNQIFKTKCGVF